MFNTIDTIIFDIGNVLVMFDEPAYLHSILKDETAAEHVYHAMNQKEYWVDLDRGVKAEEVLEKMVAADRAYEEEIRTVFHNMGQSMSRTAYAIPWIRELKDSNYRVLYLSNYSTYIMDKRPDVLDFLPYMDGGIFSCYVNMIKPDPDIFQALISKYDLIPENCVFIDDLQENLNAAQSLGMNIIRFENYQQARAALVDMLEK